MVVFQLHSDRHAETRIDLFVSEPFEFDTEYELALIGEVLPGLPARFVRIEIMLQMKVIAGREKDLKDIRQPTMLHKDTRDDR